LTVVTGSFWKDNANPWAVDGEEPEEESDLFPLENDKPDSEYRGKSIDEVDMLMARMSLNSLLKNMGEPPAF
jgi:hypothetical protein